MFRFSIRELMLMTLVVGLALGWWIDHRDQKQSRELWIEAKRMLNGEGYPVDEHNVWFYRP